MGTTTRQGILATASTVVLATAGCLAQTPPPAPSPFVVPSANLNQSPPPTGIAVPASIDATGTADASAPLNAWLSTIPDGSTVTFEVGGTYRMDKGLTL